MSINISFGTDWVYTRLVNLFMLFKVQLNQDIASFHCNNTQRLQFILLGVHIMVHTDHKNSHFLHSTMTIVIVESTSWTNSSLFISHPSPGKRIGTLCSLNE